MILIDIDMPNSCSECPISRYRGTHDCPVMRTWTSKNREKRLDCCPLRELNRSENPTSSDDCISRKAALEIYDEWFATCNIADRKASPKAKINALPPVTPIRLKGRWIKKYHADEDGLEESCSAECSSCHKRSNGYAREVGYGLKFMYYDFCPKCGSDNREVKDGKFKD